MLKDATTPSDALQILESAAEKASEIRQNFLKREDIEVKYNRPIDLAYKGSKRNGAIGKAHHTVHYNYALKAETRTDGDCSTGSGDSSEESESSKKLKLRFATLFNLTMHQAIGEVGCCKAEFAERLLNRSDSMSMIAEGLDIYRYPKSFGAVSPSRMKGGFKKYQMFLKSIEQELHSDLPHDRIVHAICELEAPEIASPEDITGWAAHLGYRVKNNVALWSNISKDITKKEEEPWVNYFERKAEVIVGHPHRDGIIAHMLYSLRAFSTEYAGVLFATLRLTGQLKELEEKYGFPS